MERVQRIIAIAACSLVGLAVLLPLAFIGSYMIFGGDYEVPLPGGYSLVRVYGSAVGIDGPAKIWFPNTIIVDPRVDGYQVYDHVVVGHVTKSGLMPTDVDACTLGYFILDTKEHKIEEGLSKKDWMHRLRKCGITREPRLRAPSRWDQLLGRNRGSLPQVDH